MEMAQPLLPQFLIKHVLPYDYSEVSQLWKAQCGRHFKWTQIQYSTSNSFLGRTLASCATHTRSCLKAFSVFVFSSKMPHMPKFIFQEMRDVFILSSPSAFTSRRDSSCTCYLTASCFTLCPHKARARPFIGARDVHRSLRNTAIRTESSLVLLVDNMLKKWNLSFKAAVTCSDFIDRGGTSGPLTYAKVAWNAHARTSDQQ